MSLFHQCSLFILLATSASGAYAQSSAPDASQARPVQPLASGSSTATSQLSIDLGTSDWNGSFGGPSSTNVNATLLGLRYKIGNLRLTAEAPYTRIDSSGAFYTGLGGTPLIVANSTAATRTIRQGLGDMTLGAAYTLPFSDKMGFDLELDGRVKLPTASTASISTGSTDFSVGTEVSKTLGKWIPFASIAYRDFGSARGVTLKSGYATSIGTTYLINSNIVALVSYDYAERASRFISDSHELVGSLSTVLRAPKIRLTGFVAGGLSSGAADVSGGLSIARAF